jgi:predicted anti-sigma-YlaC factor YlaD
LFDGDNDSAAKPSSVGGPIGVADVTHETVRDQLSDYVDASLPQADRARVDEHLRSCRSCRAVERTLRATVRAVSDAQDLRVPILMR